jgi:putative oxidoreductase
MLIRKLLIKGYELLIFGGNYMQSIFLLAFRLCWGWQFFVSGRGKFAHHIDTADFFTSLHLPFPDATAWFVSGVEAIGGLLLILGLASRLVGLTLTFNMLVAYVSVEEERNTLFNVFKDPDAFLSSDPFFFLLTAIIVFCFGPGLISADALLKKLVFDKDGKQAEQSV